MYMYFKQLFAPLVGRNPAGVWSAAKLQSLLLTLTLMVTALWVFPTAVVAQKMVKDPSTGKMVSAPKYGGTIRPVVNFKVEGIDPYFRYTAGIWISLVSEKLGAADWAFDRSVFGYDEQYMPEEVITGLLAESWENPDPLTYVFKIRDGVFWHKKAPVNGRPLTAHDVEFHYDRILGLGGGEPGFDVKTADLCKISFESVTATDDSTVVFKLKEPNLLGLSRILLGFHTFLVPREIVEQFGDMQDWRNVTGTGPYQLTDVVEGSSWTYEKIDDYWRTDPKFPDNRLPYADKVEFVIVNDPAAITSLMRSGQADYIGAALNSHLTSVDQGVNLQKTNLDLELWPFANRSETAINFDNQKEPWSDIPVRQALSLAIDQESIAENYMQGWVDASPVGAIGKGVLGYFMPYEEWPEEVKQYYRYDPKAAKKLLAEAVYPNGFKVIYEHYEFFDLGYYQIAMDYLRKNLGLDIKIQAVTRNDMIQKSLNHTFLGMRSDVWAAEYATAPAAIAGYWSQNGWRPTNVNDALFDEYYENALAATTIEEQQEWMRKADLRVAEQVWGIRGPVAPLFGATQPWIKGYNGEGDLGVQQRSTIFAYLWVDKE